MRICCAKQSEDYKWKRDGENITYKRSMKENFRYFCNLSFTITLEKRERDHIFFAYCYPYSFSKLTAFLN